jgi:hypothetical protein
MEKEIVFRPGSNILTYTDEKMLAADEDYTYI